MMAKERKLTAKEANVRKLAALTALSKHMGFVKVGSILPTPEEYERRRKRFGSLFILNVLAVLIDNNATDIQRAYACGILDLLSDKWREHISDKIITVFSRNDPLVLIWKKAVLKRDNYQCVKCGTKKYLHAHHIVRWADCAMLRISIDNGETLCGDCHQKEHPELSLRFVSNG